jgi:hypothetical protein
MFVPVTGRYTERGITKNTPLFLQNNRKEAKRKEKETKKKLSPYFSLLKSFY